MRSFSRERLRAEPEALARTKAETVVLCDANFGILPADLEFVRDLVEVRRRHGYPRALETSWAKNKSKTFYEIVDIMRREGIRSSFALALQTLGDAGVLPRGVRRTRPARLPDRPHPLILLPNTDYAERKDLYGLVTVRGDRDDFEYVLANKDMSLRQNLDMQRFLFWARLLAENLVLRRVFPALRASGGVRQSRVILSIADHIEAQPGPGARLLHRAAANSTADPDSLSPALEFCFTSTEFDDLVRGWWQANGSSLVAAEWLEPLAELIRFDLDSRPLPDAATRGLHRALTEVRDGEAVIIAERDYAYDVLDMCHGTAEGRPSAAPRRGLARIELTWKAGFAELAASTNHEETAHYAAGSRRLDGARLPAVAH